MNSCNRRQFISASLTGLAAAGLPVPFFPTPPEPEESRSATTEQGIPVRVLGRTGIEIPVVSMGVMNANNPALVQKAFDTGIRHFDTAAVYQRGRNEEMVGTVLRARGVQSDVTVATKVLLPPAQRRSEPDQAAAVFRSSLDGSLKRLRADRIDILYLHDVSDPEDLRQAWLRGAMESAKKEGKIRFAGFSTHAAMAHCLEEAIQQPWVDVVLTSFNYAMADDKRFFAAARAAAASGIGLIAMKTQCAQYWYRDELPKDAQAFYEGTVLGSAVLKWVLRHSFITTAVPGATAFQHIDDNASAARHLEYTDAEKRFLSDRKVRLGLGICRQCRSCVATCPNGADIPSLMRVHLYATCYGNLEQAADTLARLPDGRALDRCTACSTCTAQCIRSIDVARRLSELKILFA